MEHTWAQKIANLMEKEGIIKPNENKVYTFGFEIMISTVITMALIIATSFLLKEPLAWAVFCLAFIPEREAAGGFHASTPMRCHILSTAFFAAIIIVLKHFQIPAVFSLITGIALLTVMLWLAPVEAVNKPLTPEKKRKNRRTSILIAAFDVGLSILLCIQSGFWSDFFKIYYLSKWVLLGLMVYGHMAKSWSIKRKKQRVFAEKDVQHKN